MTQIRVKLKKFHSAQQQIYREIAATPRGGRYVFRAGRRFGKTTLLEEAAKNWAIKGEKIGWFTPTYKLLSPSYKECLRTLSPLKITANKNDGLITLIGGGSLEFWTLEDEDAGRSRNYDRVIIDEAGLVRDGLRDIYEQAILPTLTDRHGSAYFAGTPKGVSARSWFYQICTDKQFGFTEFHLPTRLNPHLSAEALTEMKAQFAPDVWLQEYEAMFIDWGGTAILPREAFLVNGQPVPYPNGTFSIFAVIDSAMKDGKEHDGTAITWFALDPYSETHKLTILDWDYVQIRASMLTEWLPGVLAHGEVLAARCSALMGFTGAYIEDKSSGTMMLQHGETHGMKVVPIPEKLTAKGKDGRTMLAAGPVANGQVKISDHAYMKVTTFKQETKNHLLAQVTSYVLGDPDAPKRADDVHDTVTYGVCIGLNPNPDGI
jgi:hypothetical protein